MKIKDIKTFTVGNPPPGFGGRYYVFIKLITDTGVEGVGEIYNLPYHPHIVEKWRSMWWSATSSGRTRLIPKKSGAASMAAASSSGPTLP